MKSPQSENRENEEILAIPQFQKSSDLSKSKPLFSRLPLAVFRFRNMISARTTYPVQQSKVIPAKNPNIRLFSFHCGVRICLYVRMHLCVGGGASRDSRPLARSASIFIVESHIICFRVRIYVCVRELREPRFAGLTRRLFSMWSS